ncbi:MAG: glycosyltransferase family 2 protein [Alphaproteobacteria bacterium]
MQPNSLPLSVFIIAKNEADRIADTIRSVKDIAGEVIVVDSGSSDNTMQVAEEQGATVYYHKWQGYGPQKRFAEDQCRHDWLLNLDADEVASAELVQEIRTLFAGNLEDHSGYTVRVYNMLPGETHIPSRTQMNTCLRLYNKNYGRFSNSPVHDSVILREGTEAALKSPVHHPSFRSLDHAIDKLNRYSTMQAEDMLAKRSPFFTLRLLFEFPACFIKAYFFRGYVFRGVRGFSYAMVYAFSRFSRLAKYHEMKLLRDKQP